MLTGLNQEVDPTSFFENKISVKMQGIFFKAFRIWQR